MTHKVQNFNPDGQGEIPLVYDPENRTFWASQKQMALIFDMAVNTINEHIKAVLKEMDADSVIRKIRIRADDGKMYQVNHYNHDVTLTVGFRCHSAKARAYQRWATDVLFREIMQEKRDEERDAYRPLIKTMRMASDYSSNSDETRHAFATMQDMMHYATVGLTAAGILLGRANAQKQNTPSKI